jgi:hypothetical protein
VCFKNGTLHFYRDILYRDIFVCFKNGTLHFLQGHFVQGHFCVF